MKLCQTLRMKSLRFIAGSSSFALLLAATVMVSAQTVSVSPGIINSFAGTGGTGNSGDGGSALAAKLSSPNAIRTDAAGNLYILDTGNATLRMVATNGIITTIAGTGGACASATAACGDGGPAVSAQFSTTARGLFVTAGGLIYIADSGSNRIRMINAAGVITTIAGTGTATPFSGDGAAATAATLNAPRGVYVSPAGLVYIADSGNNRIRAVSSTGIITTIAGGAATVCAGATDTVGDGCTALTAKLSLPEGLSMDAVGNLYVVDSSNSRVRRIDTAGMITTVAGNGTKGYAGDGGAATAAEINTAQDVMSDPAGDLYIADYSNNRVRYVDGNGVITTFTGTGTAAFSGDGGLANLAAINEPHGVALDTTGNVYVLDYGDSRARIVNTLTSQMSFGTVVALQSSTAQTVVLTSTGASALTIGSINLPTGYQQAVSGGTDCAAGLTLQPKSACHLSVVFAPLLSGSLNGSITVVTNATNVPMSTVTIPVTGTGSYNSTVATITTLSASSLTIYPGQSTMLTATVAGAGGTPTGTVSFYSGLTLLNTVGLTNGVAVLTTSTLPIGNDSVTAVYNGDPVYIPSTSPVVQVNSYSGPADFGITLASASANVKSGNSAALSVTVAGMNGFAGPVSLACTGLAANISCTFSPYSVTLATNASYTTLLAINTAPVTATAHVALPNGAALCLFAPLLLALVPGRRRIFSVLLALVFAASLVGIQGCSGTNGFSNAAVAPGIYTVNVQATSAGVAHSSVFTLTVQ